MAKDYQNNRRKPFRVIYRAYELIQINSSNWNKQFPQLIRRLKVSNISKQFTEKLNLKWSLQDKYKVILNFVSKEKLKTDLQSVFKLRYTCLEWLSSWHFITFISISGRLRLWTLQYPVSWAPALLQK